MVPVPGLSSAAGLVSAGISLARGDIGGALFGLATLAPGAKLLAGVVGNGVGLAAAALMRKADDVPDGVFRGGRYKDLDAPLGIERNHMPADSVSPLSKGNGPAIQMEIPDHYNTKSWGPYADAQRYRMEQAELIAEVKSDEVV